ncbi:MAG: potassium channel protein [Wenzhouxiangella sp.]|nr:MAG: potassium channel protein [Wenzhouxiangella sp.]
MNDSFAFLFFQRMRMPLIVLISAYAIATVGFTFMPGVDEEGNPWRLSLFEAFYIVSYTGSTIGFGEVPYPFSAAQRLWTIVSIYLTVIAWLFSIGTIISLLQDPAFRRHRQRARVRRGVAAIDQPFYLVCGLGDTGRLLVRALSDRDHPVVVIDHDAHKIDALGVETHRASVVASCMDARLPANLVEVGLRSRWCVGVLAVTGDDKANLKIAVTTKLLNQRCHARARADEREVAENMRSFATDQVVNPVEEYIQRLRLAFERPAAFRLYHWLQSGPDARLPETRQPPRGHWILCGFGRLGKAVHALLVDLGLEVTVIEENETLEGLPPGTIQGRGTQADTLEEAGIKGSVGILATTRDDVDNLSILITARALNPELFLGVLENGLSSHELFRAAEPDFIGQPSRVIAGSMLARISAPLVDPFIAGMIAADESICGKLIERLESLADGLPPDFLSFRISERRAPALARLLAQGIEITLDDLISDPLQPGRRWPLEVLLLRRDNENTLLPDGSTALALGDHMLLAGQPGIGRRLANVLENDNALARALTGQDLHHGWLWTRLFGQQRLEMAVSGKQLRMPDEQASKQEQDL